MSSVTSVIRISGLATNKLHALRAQAKAAGISTAMYARQLIEEGVTLELQARSKSFDELYAPAQQQFVDRGMSEEELDNLTNAARARHRRRTSGKKN